MSYDKIEKIKQELKKLSQRQVELLKTHSQQFFLYHWLQQPDPEIESVNSRIKDLKEDKENYFEILQVAASVPSPCRKRIGSIIVQFNF
jgi:NAD-specific glutamate dehydrogenase